MATVGTNMLAADSRAVTPTLLAATVLAVGCLHDVADPRTPRSEHWEIVGNHAISTDELVAAFDSEIVKPTGEFDDEVIERDLLLVQAYYWDRGYAFVKLETPIYDHEHQIVTLPLEEGPRFTMSKVALTGDVSGGEPTIQIREGVTFSRTAIAQDREALATFYQDQGYAYANVLPLTRVDADAHRIALTFEVARGEIAMFGAIEVHGSTDPQLVRSALAFASGDRFSATALDVTRQRLLASGHYEDVAIATKRGATDREVEVEVEVRERAAARD